VPQTRGVALRAIDAFEGVSAGVLLDRLIRGRAWIALLAFALIGIVTMQMLVLELNTRVGHTLARAATLQRENAQLGIEDSAYSAESRVAPLAAAGGMTLAPAGSVHFVAANPADVARAAAALSTPIQTPETVGSSESLASATGSGG
jgi:cell division protein FtsL